VYLKTLTLRGFKSFASATTLRFEPGITCVVGPNGSGKSNVVDAFSWVMGEQGVKNLRGGKMEDVVFAGTASRAPLGRAEVTVTIDNSDGALPIDYAEVTISRLLFRSGQSEYSINGDHCRLLDVQELLSDSGLGREMHVIVGQGQLDQVLHSGPEARRALIEEAAGVLKHRRRKEKALRKLEAMQVNLTRLVDLTAELRRRLKPLGRQAAIARRAAFIQADLRDARLRLLADDYVAASADLQRNESDEAAALLRRAALEASLAQARQRESALDADELQYAPRLARAQQTWFELSAIGERLRGVANLATERHTHLAARPEPPRPGRDPDELDREAAGLRDQEVELGERLETAREQLTAATGRRAAAEAALQDAERRLAAEARAAAARAERLARLRGQVGQARSRATAAQEEAARLTEALEQARARAVQAERDYQDLQGEYSGRDDDRSGLTAEHERATATLADASGRATELRVAEREASGQRAALRARGEALEEGLRALRSGADASAALLADPGRFSGVLGSVAAMVTVQDGAQDAIAAALGGAADAVAVAGLEAAVAILETLKGEDRGSAGMVIAGSAADPGSAQPAAASTSVDGRAVDGRALPEGVVRAVDCVKAPGELAGAVSSLLAGVAIAEDLRQARDVLREHPTLRVVTRDGDLLGAHWAVGGSARPPSMLALRGAADEAAAGLVRAESQCQQIAGELSEAVAVEERARQAVALAQASMQEADAAAAEISGRLGRLAGAARAAHDEAERREAAIAAAQQARDAGLAALTELQDQLAAAEAEAGEPGTGEPGAPAPGAPMAGATVPGTTVPGSTVPGSTVPGSTVPGSTAAGSTAVADTEPDREALSETAASARNAEMEGRLEVRTAEERLAAIAGRADALTAAAAAERQAAAAAIARRTLRASQAVVARAVAEGATLVLARLTESLAEATEHRQAAEQASKGRTEALKEVRAQVRQLAGELDTVVDSAHGTEIARAEQRMRLEQLAARATEEFGVDVTTLVAEYGPDVLIPASVEAAGTTGNGQAGSTENEPVGGTENGPVGGSEHGRAGSTDNGPVASTENGQAGSTENGPAGSTENGPADGAGNGQLGGTENGQVGSTANEPAGSAEYGPVGGTGSGPAGSAEHGAASTTADADRPDGAARFEGGARRDSAARPEGAARRGGAVRPTQAPGEVEPPTRYVRAEQERRAAAAQRQLDQLGKVNPLALEEFAALEERHTFLATQLEDIKKTRRDLLTVVKEVDDRVQQVFAAAFEDTAREFEDIFGRLFPGGQGRLVLTEPDDMLATGIDFEARPPGKKVKRLSLLSGGERSLTAIAFLVAIFKARPSPFYVLDEVEAALDDTNLQRLLHIFEELRASSQLIIVTHQKRTMEVADALYGISMRGDGVSSVVSQRLRERETA
jgi:chromosome segregation protein